MSAADGSCCSRREVSVTVPGSDVALHAGILSMQLFPLCVTGMITACIVGCSVDLAAAMPLTPFRYEAQAQRHCPADTVVWLDFRKEIYYSKRQRQYAQGTNGAFVCREEARRSRYRRSLLGLR
jgi:hypothetical protein